MAHKFFVGQAVAYKPIGAQVGYFKVVRQMPKEFQTVDLKYRIKSAQESFERNVLMRSQSIDYPGRAVWLAKATSPVGRTPLISARIAVDVLVGPIVLATSNRAVQRFERCEARNA